jgi:hypothetical protein
MRATSPYRPASGMARRNEQESVGLLAMKDAFRFAPELFEVRTNVMQALTDAGFGWLTHYSSVDPLHDVYGIEVCGIHEKDDALRVLELLMRMFPAWKPR